MKRHDLFMFFVGSCFFSTICSCGNQPSLGSDCGADISEAISKGVICPYEDADFVFIFPPYTNIENHDVFQYEGFEEIDSSIFLSDSVNLFVFVNAQEKSIVAWGDVRRRIIDFDFEYSNYFFPVSSLNGLYLDQWESAIVESHQDRAVDSVVPE